MYSQPRTPIVSSVVSTLVFVRRLPSEHGKTSVQRQPQLLPERSGIRRRINLTGPISAYGAVRIPREPKAGGGGQSTENGDLRVVPDESDDGLRPGSGPIGRRPFIIFRNFEIARPGVRFPRFPENRRNELTRTLACSTTVNVSRDTYGRIVVIVVVVVV